MPNRILKESICSSDTIDRLTDSEEAGFYRLLVTCDDYGRMDARLPVLRSKMYPLRLQVVTDKAIEKMLSAWEKAGLIQRYMVDGKPYLYVCTWESHQQVRAKRSKYPQMITDDCNGYQMISSASICPRNPIQSISESESISIAVQAEIPPPLLAPPTSRMVEVTNPFTGEIELIPEPDDSPITDEEYHLLTVPDMPEEPISTAKPKGEYSQDFEVFWSAYPRKVEKRGAGKAWDALLKLKGAERPTPAELIAAATHYAAYCRAKKTEAEFMKLPATFLSKSKRPFEEYVEGVPTATGTPAVDWDKGYTR